MLLRHMSVIVGRRANPVTRECRYLVRNSWGAGCSGYTLELQKRCEGGYLWLTREELRQNLYGLTYLD